MESLPTARDFTSMLAFFPVCFTVFCKVWRLRERLAAAWEFAHQWFFSSVNSLVDSWDGQWWYYGVNGDILSALCWRKVLPQLGCKHRHGFESVWIRLCCTNACSAENFWPHTSHSQHLTISLSEISSKRGIMKDLQFVWLAIWRSSLPLWENPSLDPLLAGRAQFSHLQI